MRLINVTKKIIIIIIKMKREEKKEKKKKKKKKERQKKIALKMAHGVTTRILGYIWVVLGYCCTYNMFNGCVRVYM